MALSETALTHEPRAARGQTVHWVIAVILAFIAGSLWTRSSSTGSIALAQTTPLAGSRGVFAFTGQIDQNQWGLFMLDIEQGTLWCYELDEVNGVRKLRLAAARSWIYDRYLREFNIAAPTPDEIRNLVGKQRAQPTPDAGGDDEKSRKPASASKTQGTEGP